MDGLWMRILIVASLLAISWPSLLCSSTPGLGRAETTSRRPMPVQVSCSDYPSCSLDLSLIRNATKTGINQMACRHIHRSYHCQRSVTQRCEEQGMLAPNILAMMKRAYIHAEIHMQEVCHSGSLPDDMIAKGGSHCSEFRSCFDGVKKFKSFARMSRYEEACSIASTIQLCATSSLSDCRRRGNLSSEALGFMQRMTEQAGARVHISCALTTTTTTPSYRLPTTIRCVDYANCPRPDLDVIQLAQRTKQFQEACQITKPYAKCIEAATTDCGERKMVSAMALQSMKMVVLRANRDVETFCQFEIESSPGNAMMDEGILLSDLKATTVVTSRASSPSPTTYEKVRCLDIGSCPRPPALRSLQTPELRGTMEHRVACNTLKAHNKCIEYATNDCRKRQLITGAPFKSMVRAVKESKDMIQRSCMETKEMTDNHGHSSRPQRLHYYGIACLYILFVSIRGVTRIVS